MRVRMLLQITTDDDAPGEIEEIASFTKSVVRAEELGLTLAEGKILTATIQRRIVQSQIDAWIEGQRCCDDCGRRLRGKGTYPVVFHTLFGDVPLRSLRFHRCACRDEREPATLLPLTRLIPDHVAPEHLYLETR